MIRRFAATVVLALSLAACRSGAGGSCSDMGSLAYGSSSSGPQACDLARDQARVACELEGRAAACTPPDCNCRPHPDFPSYVVCAVRVAC